MFQCSSPVTLIRPGTLLSRCGRSPARGAMSLSAHVYGSRTNLCCIVILGGAGPCWVDAWQGKVASSQSRDPYSEYPRSWRSSKSVQV